jgi:hypothetical protein
MAQDDVVEDIDPDVFEPDTEDYTDESWGSITIRRMGHD